MRRKTNTCQIPPTPLQRGRHDVGPRNSVLLPRAGKVQVRQRSGGKWDSLIKARPNFLRRGLWASNMVRRLFRCHLSPIRHLLGIFTLHTRIPCNRCGLTHSNMVRGQGVGLPQLCANIWRRHLLFRRSRGVSRQIATQNQIMFLSSPQLMILY